MKYIFLLLLAISTAHADDYLTTTLASHHRDREAGYNEANYGLGIKHDQMIAGFYRNSHYRTSYYAGYEYRRSLFGMQLGLLSGYEDTELSTPSIKGVHVYALPMLVLGNDVQHKIGLVPVDQWTITYQIDWKF